VKYRPTPRLIDLVRSTLERVASSERSEDQKSAIDGLRRSVIRNIAEHELHTASSEPDSDLKNLAEEPKPKDSAA